VSIGGRTIVHSRPLARTTASVRRLSAMVYLSRLPSIGLRIRRVIGPSPSVVRVPTLTTTSRRTAAVRMAATMLVALSAQMVVGTRPSREPSAEITRPDRGWIGPDRGGVHDVGLAHRGVGM
jgi:hypothetical protein